MGDGRRVARVEAEVLRLVSEYLITRMRGELPGILTVSRVKMPADLRAARVYVSIINHQGSYKPVLELLQKRAGEIQRHIADNMQARYVPKLTFYEDDVTDKVLKIEGILRDISGTATGSATHGDGKPVYDKPSDSDSDVEDE